MPDRLPNIDFHSHILPRTDHGCSCSSQAKAQLLMMRDAGTDIAVATPHFYPHVHNISEFEELVDSALLRLGQLDIQKAPLLCVGAEVLLCENMHQLDCLGKLCIRGTNVLFLELPTEDLNIGYYKTVEAIMEAGYTVVLAHIDRYLKKNSNFVCSILNDGALAQINPYALSMLGPKKRINSILSETESIVAIGSDLHGANAHALDDFLKFKKRLGNNYAEINARANKLLENAELIDFTKKD